jgi:3-phosphoshikimate 1-carboxyvinyltransferase
MSSSRKYLRISGRPRTFSGTVRLPPSKSYLHRALFVAGQVEGQSRIANCGSVINDDIIATIGAMRLLGSAIKFSSSRNGSYQIVPGSPKRNNLVLNAGGSGTTARFLIPYSSLSPAGTKVKIIGNESLSKRPMDTIFEPLSRLGVNVKSFGNDGRLPVEVEGGGILGGECEIDGSVSSQFVSGLLISCVRADKNAVVTIKNPEDQVSTPYIEATIQVIRAFGFKLQVTRTEDGKYSSFVIPGNQLAKGSKFMVPGDMSSAAALLSASIAAGGRVRLTNAGEKIFPQPDATILQVAKKFGANVEDGNGTISVSFRGLRVRRKLSLDLNNSPDLVPSVAGLAAATETPVLITNIEHLRFKESDRLEVLSRELFKIGVITHETKSSLELLSFGSQKDRKDNTLICPEGDHRMLMALTIAGLSGHFGTIYIEDPDCVRKSYPSFVRDLQKLCHDQSTVRIVNSHEISEKRR